MTQKIKRGSPARDESTALESSSISYRLQAMSRRLVFVEGLCHKLDGDDLDPFGSDVLPKDA